MACRLAGFNDEFQIAFDIHSHPGEVRDASVEDMTNIINRYWRFYAKELPLCPHYVYHKRSRTLYEYTPWDDSINKGTIRNNDGLNSIMQR
jgi:hypothetical protein